MPDLSSFEWTVIIAVGVVAVIGFYAWRNASTGQQWDPMSLVGLKGIAQGTFAAEGTVHIRGEIWRARSRHGIVEKGDEVVVRAVHDGMVLEVERAG